MLKNLKFGSCFHVVRQLLGEDNIVQVHDIAPTTKPSRTQIRLDWIPWEMTHGNDEWLTLGKF